MKKYHTYNKEYGVIVIGGGHAGCEAALASSRMGIKTLLLTIHVDTIALMSCNPAIGGLAKGQLVREIDALGGEMAKCIDKTGSQFRVLNTRKGPAVQSYRAQADRSLYSRDMKARLENQESLDIKQGMVERLHIENGTAKGVFVDHGILYRGKAIIVGTGTFLNGLIHIGSNTYPAGRAGEFSAIGLSESYRELGFSLGRLKTGTPPRLNSKTIDFSGLIIQNGDKNPNPFSFATESIEQRQVPCYITHTNIETNKIISENLDRSPLYSGAITGIGPRYCPSIEDKVKRFPDRESHHVFLEPEGYSSKEYYPNGVSTSLPVDVQLEFLRTIKGLEKVEIVRPGYAIEYDFVFPTQLRPTLETKQIRNLFHAGQINGTSGYEEAAAQGLLAGINAALQIKGEGPLILGRGDAYIGVLIDDLVLRGTEEPYRMFTSRAEYRLLLRTDNADLRLSDIGYRIGLLDEKVYENFLRKRDSIESEIKRLKSSFVGPDEKLNQELISLGESPLQETTLLADLLKRPLVKYENLPIPDNGIKREITDVIKRQVEIQIKYDGYIKRQLQEIERLKRFEEKKIPDDFDYSKVDELSNEIHEKLDSIRPTSLRQAARISGVTPSSIASLMIHMVRGKRKRVSSEKENKE